MFGSPRQGQLVSGWLQNGHRNAVHQLNTDQLHNNGRLPGQGWCGRTIRKPDLSIYLTPICLKFRLYNYNYSRDWSKLGFATQTATTSRRAFSKIKACSLLVVVFSFFFPDPGQLDHLHVYLLGHCGATMPHVKTQWLPAKFYRLSLSPAPSSSFRRTLAKISIVYYIVCFFCETFTK